MNFQLDGGTPQQQRWVQDAIAQCSYPLDSLNATVTVQWANQMPSNADSRHPYMVTQVQSDGSFLVTVASWADDPSNPGNQGLPNPQQDIYEFYKQSFVHELGHVVIDSTFNPGGADTDPRVQTMCGLFWRATVDSGTGRRFGTMSDWDASSLAWADEVREAVAECFKCGFYTGRLLFMNRTHWNIDAGSWAQFLSLISIPVSGGFDERWQTDWSGLTGVDVISQSGVITPGDPGTLAVAAGTELEIVSKQPVVATAMMSVEIVDSVNGTGGWMQLRADQDDAGTNEGGVTVDFGSPVSLVVGGWPNGGSAPPNVSENITLPPAPFWLVLRQGASTLTGEIWTTDPWKAGGSPADSVALSGWVAYSQSYTRLNASVSGGTQVTFGEWRHGTSAGATAIAPYPFAPLQGNLTVSPGYRGAVLLGV